MVTLPRTHHPGAQPRVRGEMAGQVTLTAVATGSPQPATRRPSPPGSRGRGHPRCEPTIAAASPRIRSEMAGQVTLAAVSDSLQPARRPRLGRGGQVQVAHGAGVTVPLPPLSCGRQRRAEPVPGLRVQVSPRLSAPVRHSPPIPRWSAPACRRRWWRRW